MLFELKILEAIFCLFIGGKSTALLQVFPRLSKSKPFHLWKMRKKFLESGFRKYVGRVFIWLEKLVLIPENPVCEEWSGSYTFSLQNHIPQIRNAISSSLSFLTGWNILLKLIDMWQTDFVSRKQVIENRGILPDSLFSFGWVTPITQWKFVFTSTVSFFPVRNISLKKETIFLNLYSQSKSCWSKSGGVRIWLVEEPRSIEW